MPPDRHISARPPGGTLELLAIAFPMVVSHACETLMMFTDRLFLSRLGPEYMSAAMGGGLTCFMFTTFFMGLTGYANALVAQHMGAGQPQRCAGIITQTLLITIVAYPVILLCMPAGHALFQITRIPERQLHLQTDYFNLLMAGTILGLLRNCLSSFFSGIGRTRIVMLSAAIAMTVNIFANYVLIFGAMGFPALGMRGAAIGTLIGSLAGLLVLAIRYTGPTCRSAYGTTRNQHYDRTLMSQLLRLGTPSGIEFFLNMLAFDVLVLCFHSYGVAVAAAITITFNWDLVAFVPLLGIGIGVTSLVGRYMGAQDPDKAHQVTRSGLKLAAIYTSLAFMTFCLFPEPLVRLFRPAGPAQGFDEVVPLAVFMIRWMSMYVFADSIGIVFGGALRGAGDTFWTMVISVAAHWVFALTALVMIRFLEVEPRTTWIVVVLLVVGLGATFWLRYRTGRWRSLRVVESVPPPPLTDDREVHG